MVKLVPCLLKIDWEAILVTSIYMYSSSERGRCCVEVSTRRLGLQTPCRLRSAWETSTSGDVEGSLLTKPFGVYSYVNARFQANLTLDIMKGKKYTYSNF